MIEWFPNGDRSKGLRVEDITDDDVKLAFLLRASVTATHLGAGQLDHLCSFLDVRDKFDTEEGQRVRCLAEWAWKSFNKAEAFLGYMKTHDLIQETIKHVDLREEAKKALK